MDNLLSEKQSTITAVLSEDMNPEDVRKTLSTCCSVFRKLEMAHGTLKPIIGRLLVLVQTHPAMHKAMGYSTFEEFLKREVCDRLGLSRSNAYDAKRIIQTFPGLTIEEFEAIGSTKLLVIAKTGRVKSDTEPRAQKLLARAKDPSVSAAQLKDEIYASGVASHDDDTMTEVTIPCSIAEARQWKEFWMDPAIQEYCGTSRPGEILSHLISEVIIEWQGTIAHRKAEGS